VLQFTLPVRCTGEKVAEQEVATFNTERDRAQKLGPFSVGVCFDSCLFCSDYQVAREFELTALRRSVLPDRDFRRDSANCAAILPTISFQRGPETVSNQRFERQFCEFISSMDSSICTRRGPAPTSSSSTS